MDQVEVAGLRVAIELRLRFALKVADLLPGGFEPTSVPGLFSNAMAPDAVDELVAIMSDIRPVANVRHPPGGDPRHGHALAEADLLDVLPAIDVPTLLLYGDADERSPLDVAEDLRNGIPTSRLVIMAGLGHMSYLESPERFNAEVRSFLRSLA